MSKKEIQSQIQKLDGELSTVINVLMIIVGFFLVEVILLACNLIFIDIFSILGLTGLIGAFYVQFKSARMKARILVILENLNKNI
jgi:uncharacterized membrane protein